MEIIYGQTLFVRGLPKEWNDKRKYYLLTALFERYIHVLFGVYVIYYWLCLISKYAHVLCLCNSLSYSRILIGCRQRSIGGKNWLWLCFKMAENFENFTWPGEDKVQKRLVEALNRYERQEEVRRSRFFCRKWLRKNTRAVSVGSWARLNQTQNWSCLPQVLSTPAVFKTTSELFGSQGCSDDKNLPWFFQHFL